MANTVVVATTPAIVLDVANYFWPFIFNILAKVAIAFLLILSVIDDKAN